MNSKTFLLGLTLTLNLFSGNSFGEDAAANVNAELSKTQGDFQATYSQLKKSLKELESERVKAVQEAKSQALKDKEGIKAFQTYDSLLSARYVNTEGQYVSALEVSRKDHENLNHLFANYLKMSPLSGRLSAGHARKYITWAVDRLMELEKMNSNPSDKNNPELEIIARLKQENEDRMEVVSGLAKRLGVKLEEASSFAESEKDKSRLPASSKP